MTPGVYQILNIVTQDFYIGSSVFVERRWGKHLSALRRGNHHSRYLQRAWGKYGEEAFQFRLVEEYDPQDLPWQEQWWITNTACVYNMNRLATAGQPGKKHSHAAKAKMRAAHNTAAFREASARWMRKNWQSTTYRKAACARAKEFLSRPDVKAKKSAATKAFLAAGDNLEKMAARVKAAMNTDEVRQECQQRMLTKWRDPSYRNARSSHLAKLAAMQRSSEQREKRRAEMVALWKDPAYRARMAAARSRPPQGVL